MKNNNLKNTLLSIKGKLFLLVLLSLVLLNTNSLVKADTEEYTTVEVEATTSEFETTTNNSEEPTSNFEETTTNIIDEPTTNFEEPTSNIEEPTTGFTEPAKKILFIGNSATYYNDMPKMLKGLANADGKQAEITAITASGYKLSQFTSVSNVYYAQLINQLQTNSWDFVVLQDHREVIIQNPSKTEEAISILKKYIDAAGAQLIIYETQADSKGREFFINNSSIFMDNLTMQFYMSRNYYSIGNKFNALVCSAGDNYSRCMNLYPNIVLYNKDLLHPSPYGSYMVACSLYKTIFKTSALDNTFLPGSKYDTDNLLKDLDAESLKKLQNIADATLTLSQNNIELIKGTSTKLTATFDGSKENISLDGYKNIPEYFSLNDNIAFVNRSDGTITALNTGNTMVMSTTDSGLRAFCNVNVIQPASSFIIAEAYITKVHKKDTFAYTTTLTPADTTDKITWVSNNPAVATVDQNGTVTAKKVGIAKITATTDHGIKLTRYVRVKLITPTNVKAKKLSTKAKNKKYANIKITWKKNKNAVSYYVYRSKKKGSGYKKIATTKTAKYTDKNRKKGQTFYYKIRSVYSNTKCNSYISKYTKIKLAK